VRQETVDSKKDGNRQAVVEGFMLSPISCLPSTYSKVYFPPLTKGVAEGRGI